MTVKDVPIGILNGTYDVVYTPRNDSNEPDDISRRLRYNLTGLMKFIGYTFHMTAYTIKGEGPMSMGDMTMTDEDGKLLSTFRFYCFSF